MYPLGSFSFLPTMNFPQRKKTQKWLPICMGNKEKKKKKVKKIILNLTSQKFILLTVSIV